MCSHWVPTRDWPLYKELKEINHSAQGSRTEASCYFISSFLSFLLVSGICLILVWCASRDKPTNKKAAVWHCLLFEMPVLPRRAVFGDEKTRIEALCISDVTEALGRGRSSSQHCRDVKSADDLFTGTTWNCNLHQKFLCCQPAAR